MNPITVRKFGRGLLGAAIGALALASSAGAQLRIDWYTTEGGGGKSASGQLTLEGTISQIDAGVHSGGASAMLNGGYWNEITGYPTMTFYASVELKNVNISTFTRCITFQFFNGNCPTPAATVDAEMTFVNRMATAPIQIPAGDYTCVTARDRRHTLRMTADPGYFSLLGEVYYGNFTGPDALPSGNLNDDAFVDILDFGVFVGQYGTNYGSPNTSCSLTFPHADFNGDALANGLDYSFISSNFLRMRDPDCCGNALAGSAGPVQDISVYELAARGTAEDWEIARVADLTRDGRVNQADVQFLFAHGKAACMADFNGVNGVSTDDLFLYLAAWFLCHPATDVNADRSIGPDDLFLYLNAFLSGC